jgi:hypothetical protein
MKGCVRPNGVIFPRVMMLAEVLLRHVGFWAPSLRVPRFLAYSAESSGGYGYQKRLML